MADIHIDPRLDPRVVKPVFARTGRVHLPGFLDEGSARVLHAALSEDTPWRRSLIVDGRSMQMDPEELAALPEERQAAIEADVMRRARDGFQYAFDSWAVSDEIEAGRRIGHPAEAFYDLINSRAFFRWIEQATGESRAVYADAQCTRYGPGDFLTGHTDAAEGKHRLFAYVMNLTPTWTADWGGLLAFIDGDGHVSEAFTPAWNALNIFRVPQPHCVTSVAPFAGGRRLSITGWIRAKRP